MKNGAIRRSARKILARAKDTEARGNRATASNNLALRNYAPAPKYDAEFPECSHFRARTLHEGDVITGPLPSGYLNLDWVHIEPRRTFGPWGYSSSRINPATSRTSPRTEAIVAKIEENWGWTGRGFWETFKGKIHSR